MCVLVSMRVCVCVLLIFLSASHTECFAYACYIVFTGTDFYIRKIDISVNHYVMMATVPCLWRQHARRKGNQGIKIFMSFFLNLKMCRWGVMDSGSEWETGVPSSTQVRFIFLRADTLMRGKESISPPSSYKLNGRALWPCLETVKEKNNFEFKTVCEPGA